MTIIRRREREGERGREREREREREIPHSHIQQMELLRLFAMETRCIINTEPLVISEKREREREREGGREIIK